MNRGSQHPPYRPPCGGTVLCSNGPRYQHAKPKEQNIPVYLYDGQVPNYNTGIGGNIDPYERINPANPCAIFPDPCAGVNDCSGSTYPPCCPWVGTLGSCQYDIASPPPVSWYQPQMCTGVSIVSGGTGYVVGETLTAAGGTISGYIGAPNQTTAVITNVDGSGKILSLELTQPGSYKVAPSSPNAMTGVVYGSGASIALTFGNQTENLAVCHKYGFKNVQAMRQWHGVEGYYFDLGQIGEYQCPSDSSGDMCGYTFYNEFANTASQSKYTTLAYDIGYDYTDLSGGSGSFTASKAGTVTVNPQSGLLSATGITNSDPGGNIAAFMGGSNAISQSFGPQSHPQDWLNQIVGLFPIADLGDPDFIFACGSGSWSVTNNVPADTTYGIEVEKADWTIGTNSASGDYYNFYDTTYGYGVIYSFSISDSTLSFTYTENFPGGSPPYKLVVTFTVTLSGSNTAANVLNDIDTLLNEWDLTDDAKYPWRTDQYTSIAPLVSRNEVPSNVSPWNAGFVPSGYTDPNAALYDGSILGAPMPAGYQGFFDFRFTDYRTCAGPPEFGYVYGWGQKNGGQNGIPLNATQWTPNAIGWQMPGGAWIFYNHNPSWTGFGNPGSAYNFDPAPVCLAQKWAETKLGFASQNFFRPAGADKFAYDESYITTPSIFNVYAINSTNTTNGVTKVYLIDPISCSNANISPNPGTQTICNDANAVISNGSGIWGGASVNGFFEVSGNGNPFTLGSKVYNLPSDWASSSSYSNGNATVSDAGTAFGQLLYPNAPAILGRAAVTGIANTNTANTSELTTISLPTLGMGISASDMIDIYDENMNLLSGNKAATRVSDTQFTVPVSFSTVQNAAYIMSNGAPAYYWDDTYPKGDYAYTDWTWWPRKICEADRWNNLLSGCNSTSAIDFTNYGANCTCPTGPETVEAFPFSAFTQTAGCVGFSPCNPSVICISPNGESFPVGHTFSFPSINFDDEYGSGWQAEIQQVMQDLLYQTPHFPAIVPCSPAAFAWIADDGSCAGSGGTTQYYPHPPLVECRITLPNNGGPSSNAAAPALPSSTASCCSVNEICIGWTAPVGIVAGACFPNNTLFPANSNGYGLGGAALWRLWSNECGCIDANGEFAANYENSALGCS